jgi:hypothetical protein
LQEAINKNMIQTLRSLLRLIVGPLASRSSRHKWVIANHGSVTIGEVSADVGCVAAAADPHLCYAMLARRERESLIDLMGRLDRAIADAAESSITVDEINPPGGFKPSGKR